MRGGCFWVRVVCLWKALVLQPLSMRILGLVMTVGDYTGAVSK